MIINLYSCKNKSCKEDNNKVLYNFLFEKNKFGRVVSLYYHKGCTKITTKRRSGAFI